MKMNPIAVAAILALALPAYADDAHRHEGNTMTGDESCPMHDGGPGGMGTMGKGMMGMMAPAEGPGRDAMTARMQQMEKRMDMMQTMMEQMMKPAAAAAK